MPTAPHFQCRSLSAELFPSYLPTCPFTLMHILCLGYRLACFAAKGAKTKHQRTEHVRGMSRCPAFRHRLTSLWHTFFRTIALMEFVLKNACQQLCSFSLAPCQRSYACPMAQGLETLAALGRTLLRNNRIDEICPTKTRANSSAFLVPLPASEAMHVTSPNVCKPLEKSWAHNFSGQSH